MADVKISALPAATTPLGGTEVLPIVQSGSTVKVSIADVTAGRTISAANIGVGNTSPSYRLDVTAGDTTAGLGYGMRLRANDTANGGSFQFTDNAVTAQWAYITANTSEFRLAADSRPLTFFVDSERARITTDGEFLIAGTTDQGAYNLQVNGTGVWGAGAYVNGSDRNLKEEIAPLGDALDLVNALKPVTFRYKKDYSKDQFIQPGFIAQELQEALAEQVYLDGVVQAGPEHLNVAYQSLIPVLVKAIQELTARVAALES